MRFILEHYRTIIITLGVAHLVFAVLLLFMSNWLVHVNRILKKWISTQKISEALNSVRDIDEHIIRMRKVLGIISLGIGLLFILVFI